MNFVHAIAEHSYLQHALIGTILASVLCGMIGPLVVARRMSHMVGGMSHAVLGGMGIAYFMHADPLWGALIAAIALALIMAWMHRQHHVKNDTLMSALWALGMAIGLLFMAHGPGNDHAHEEELLHFLFGDVLSISNMDLMWIAVLSFVLLILMSLFYKYFMAISFDEVFCRLAGVRTRVFHDLFYVMVAVTVVVLVHVAGLILAIALITLPAAFALLLSRSLKRVMCIATLCSLASGFIGLYLAHTFSWPASPSIVLVVALIYFIALLSRR